MSDGIQERLAQLRDDYARVAQTPFKHFFCPILWTDEAVALCMGHVVNKAFSNKWVVQREDIDNFYGSTVEADFQAALECKCKGQSLDEVISDPNLRKKANLRLTCDDENVGLYFYNKHKSPNHSRAQYETASGELVDLAYKMSRDDSVAARNKQWAFHGSRDDAPAAAASLIKAAHLTMFYLFEYRYALSAAGRYVGHNILGGFYRQNREKPLKEAKEAAKTYFSEFTNIVAPLGNAGHLMEGTVNDNRVFFYFQGSSGEPFGMGVIVKTNELLWVVLIPFVCENGDGIAAYLDFLRNDNESVATILSQFNTNTGTYEVVNGIGVVRERWHKGGSS